MLSATGVARPSSQRFSSLVQFWYPQRDSCRWVLASLFDTQGSAYRKSGAQLFINDLGQWFGLISGGCLEAEIVRLAQRVFADGRPREHIFDSLSDDEPGLSTGCGGVLRVRLQAITAENAYLDLPAVYAAVQAREPGVYWQAVSGDAGLAYWQNQAKLDHQARLSCRDGVEWLATSLDLSPSLLVLGGGVDARPLAALAHTLGWQVSVCDMRVSTARRADFAAAVRLLHLHPDDLPPDLLAQQDAVIIMHHSLTLDAAALRRLHGQSNLRYLGLLGPPQRRTRVLALAGLTTLASRLPLASPAGLQLGGDLPESVALSILAEIHAVLHGASANSYSGLLTAPLGLRA